MFLFAVARWGQRNLTNDQLTIDSFIEVSIRCREMGTAEHDERRYVTPEDLYTFLFAVARWGQRNGVLWHGKDTFLGVSIRCREMGTAEQERAGRCWGLLRVSIRCREMGTAERRL